MGFNVYIKRLWLQLRIWRIVNTWNSFGWGKMMKVCSKFMELCSCRLLLQFCLFQGCLSCKFLQLFSDLFVLGCNVMKIAFPCIEIMFILSWIVASVVLLYYFGLFHKESWLLIFIFILFSRHELETPNIASPDSLNLCDCFLFILELPLFPIHPLPLLNSDSSRSFLISIFFSLVKSEIIRVNHISMASFSLPQVLCHY